MSHRHSFSDLFNFALCAGCLSSLLGMLLIIIMAVVVAFFTSCSHRVTHHLHTECADSIAIVTSTTDSVSTFALRQDHIISVDTTTAITEQADSTCFSEHIIEHITTVTDSLGISTVTTSREIWRSGYTFEFQRSASSSLSLSDLITSSTLTLDSIHSTRSSLVGSHSSDTDSLMSCPATSSPSRRFFSDILWCVGLSMIVSILILIYKYYKGK